MNEKQIHYAANLESPTTYESFPLLQSDDDELQTLHICILAIERRLKDKPDYQARVVEYLHDRYAGWKLE